MKTLLALFDERRSDLRAKLEQAEGLQHTVSLLQAELDTMQNRYIGTLTAPQARVVSPMLAVLPLAVGILAAVNEPKVWHETPKRARGSDKPRPSWPSGLRWLTRIDLADINVQVLKVRMLQGLICLGLLSGLLLWTRETLTAWPAMLLVVSLVFLEVSGMPRARRVGPSGHPDAAGGPKVTVDVDANMLLDGLASALDVIDRAVPAVTGPADGRGEPGRSDPIEGVPDLLEVIQNLLAESFRDDAQLTLRRSRELPGVLAQYGVRIETYELPESGDPELEPSDWFDFEPSLDPKLADYKTLKPALVKGGRVLQRGRVVTPADTIG